MSAKSRKNSSSSSGLRLFWNRKTRQFVAISIQVTTGGYRDGTAFLSGIIYAPANGSRWHRRTWLSIHLCRCGLAFTVCLGVVTPVASWCSMVQRDARWCNGATARRRLRVLRVTCNAGDLTPLARATGIQSAIDGFICHALGPVEDQS